MNCRGKPRKDVKRMEIENEKFLVKVTAEDPIAVIGMQNALELAQKELLRLNKRFSEATIYRENEMGLRTEAICIKTGGCYSRPSDAIKHGYPFTAYQNGNYWGKLNLNGTFVQEGQ